MMHHRFVIATGTALSLCLFFVLAACQAPQAQHHDATLPAGSGAVNTLSSQERAQGWQLLFDGETLEGWRGMRREDVPVGWVVQDGTLHFTGERSGDIITQDQYENFELSLEWNISEAGNSGIFFRVDEEKGVIRSPEYQLLDDERHPDGLNGPHRKAGANYDMHAPSTLEAVKPPGEWNHTRIVVNGAHVEHWLNGQKVVEYELWSDDWKQRVADSKFSSMEDYGYTRVGHIVLQDHRDPISFRNIKIRPL